MNHYHPVENPNASWIEVDMLQNSIGSCVLGVYARNPHRDTLLSTFDGRPISEGGFGIKPKVALDLANEYARSIGQILGITVVEHV